MELRFLAGRQKYHPAYEFSGGMRLRVDLSISSMRM
jgi:hypothetical protein